MGHSGVHGELALEAKALLAEMNRFGIEQALVSQFTAEEYDAEEGNRALARDLQEGPGRFVPAWAALPERAFLEGLARYKPAAVRLFSGSKEHNFSLEPWCSGPLYEYLEAHSILAVITREDIEWDGVAQLFQNFPRLSVLLLETGYRAERYLEPLLRSFPQLYFDSSTLLAHRQLESFVEQFGHERIVFGSRLPLYTPGAALAVLATARISEDAKRAIAGGTLRRLLRMSRSEK
ncbi:MAG: amidohydrolase family protein [Candidatus Dormibacteria bacterium]